MTNERLRNGARPVDPAGSSGIAIPRAKSGTQMLSIQMLSSFQVYRNGEALDGCLRGKGRQLLKILAANWRKHLPKDLLIEMLWPDGDPGSGATSLKVAAHSLRTALEPERQNGHPGRWIIVEHGTYRLNPEADIWIDVRAFQEHYAHAKELDDQGKLGDARAALDKAEALYTGDFLEEDIYEDWTVVRREELRDLYLDALGRLADMARREEAHSDVIRHCHKIVLADPCREDAYRLLMESHGALNQIARAGAWYAVCRANLLREIDAVPSAETAAAFEGLFGDSRRGPLSGR